MRADNAEVPPNPNSRNLPSPVTRTYKDKTIHAIPFEDEVLFLVVEVEIVLDYEKHQLSKSIAQWIKKGKMREAAHTRKLTNGKLNAFKAAIGNYFAIHEVVDPRSPSLLVLTEAGLNRVLMLSGTDVAIAFQDWVEQEVLPAIRKSGRYEAGPAALPPPPAPAALPAPAPRMGFPRSPAPQAVHTLRVMVDTFRGRGIDEQVWMALNVALAQVESMKTLGSSLDDIPVYGYATSRSDPALVAMRFAIHNRLVEVAPDDVERVYRWIRTRPMWVGEGEPVLKG